MTYAENNLHGHYVTARITASRTVVLAGPFLYHRQAAAYVDAARRALRELNLGTDRSAEFLMAGYGVARFTRKPGANRIAGHLNSRLGLFADPISGYLVVDESVAT